MKTHSLNAKPMLLLFTLLAMFSAGRGQDFQKTGTTGFVFLELPVVARSAAMGETGITLPDAGAAGLFINPALIPLSTNRLGLNVSFADWYVETTHQAVGLIYKIPAIGTVGFQATYFDFGEMNKTVNPSASETGSYIDLGTFSAGAYFVGVSFGRSLTDKFSFGASLKYIRETIDQYHADNGTIDMGFVYLTGFRSLRIGAFLQNFGLEAKYATEKFKMPQQLKMGLSGEVWGNLADDNHLTVLVEAAHPNDADERILLGAESVLMKALVLRAGYKFGFDEENLCLGAGLRLRLAGRHAGIDFSYMNHKHLDTTLRYTFTMEL
ncbi:MAG: PorV/PorQ family protein [Candidatus Zhuqueibacterota bacterium]